MSERDEKCFLRMRLIRKTDNAVLVTNCTAPGISPDAVERRGALVTVPGREWWLPRSLMGTTQVSSDITKAGNYQHINFSLPEWKVEQDQLWDYVTS